MTTDEAIAFIRCTPRVPGREPSPGELLVAEIDRLRARVSDLEADAEWNKSSRAS